jgi:peroxiredoxin
MNEQTSTPALTVGDRVPRAVFKTRVRDESVGGDNPFVWKDVTTDDIFGGRRVAVFSLPGAFSPHAAARICRDSKVNTTNSVRGALRRSIA